MNKKKIAQAIVALLILGLTIWGMFSFLPRNPDGGAAVEPDREAVEEPAVRLSDAKLAIAGIRTQPAQIETLQPYRSMPARFTYDDTRHVAVRAATDGLLESVKVKPGDRVKQGQVIAVLRSPAIADARSDVLNRQAELELAIKQSEWQSNLCDGVDKLAEAIGRNDQIESIQKQVNGTTLGVYRSRLLNAYSTAKLTANAAESAAKVGSSGAISGRVIRQRQNAGDQAKASLNAIVEQSVFETHQACRQASTDTQAAERSLNVAKHRLATLMGGMDDALKLPAIESDIARVSIRSPISGTVERKVYSATERVSQAAEMFIIADTSQLWVEADIRGRDWNAMSLQEGNSVFVTTPVNANEPLQAVIHFVGREVDTDSGAIPLVARVSNSKGSFRPGLFARMNVPVGPAIESVAVPDTAILDVGGESTVFVEIDGAFHPVTVETGVRSRGLVEIRRGISVGQQIVVEGAFVLKSEFLLEGEE